MPCGSSIASPDSGRIIKVGEIDIGSEHLSQVIVHGEKLHMGYLRNSKALVGVGEGSLEDVSRTCGETFLPSSHLGRSSA